MKLKNIFFGIISLKLCILFLFITLSCKSQVPDGKIIILNKIVHKLKGKKFDIAKIKNMNIILYQEQENNVIIKYNEIYRIQLASPIEFKIYGITKIEDNILFTLGGSVDDEWGFLYSPSNRISFNGSGLARVKRVMGHSHWYEFSTML